jgi:1,4-dihydroxy-6-naphthoate synthase
MDNRGVSLEFVRNHAQEMELEIINSHIDLYVNNYSISLGHEGKDAVKLLLLKAGIVDKDIFL